MGSIAKSHIQDPWLIYPWKFSIFGVFPWFPKPNSGDCELWKVVPIEHCWIQLHCGSMGMTISNNRLPNAERWCWCILEPLQFSPGLLNQPDNNQTNTITRWLFVQVSNYSQHPVRETSGYSELCIMNKKLSRNKRMKMWLMLLKPNPTQTSVVKNLMFCAQSQGNLFLTQLCYQSSSSFSGNLQRYRLNND